MPQSPILSIDIFYYWGIDFMRSFPKSNQYEYNLVIVEYVSKWVKAIPAWRNDHSTIISFLKENIPLRFGAPKAIINDHGTHFYNRPIEKLTKKYGVSHKVATTYHP